MAFPSDYSPADLDIPTAADFNGKYRTGLLYLKEGDAALTSRVLPVLVPQLESQMGAPELRHGYTSGGGVFKVIGEPTGGAVAAVGDRIVLDVAVSERDEGTERLAGRYEAEKTSTGGGSLTVDPYHGVGLAGQQEPNDPPALRIDEAGLVFIGKASGAAAVNVGGDVQARAYYVNGVLIGLWRLVGREMQFDGDAEVTGTLIAGAENDEGLDVGGNSTLNPNLNAAKMRGYGWSTDTTMKAATVAAQALPAGAGGVEWTTVLSFPPAPRPGHWDFDVEMRVPTTSDGHRDGPVYLRVPGGWDEDNQFPFGSSGAAVGHTHQCKGMGSVQLALGEVAVIEAANTSTVPAVCHVSGVARWQAPDIGVLSEPFRLVWHFGTMVYFTPPTQVQNLAAAPYNSGELVLTWDALVGAVTYTLYRAPTSGGTFVEVADLIAGTTYTDTGLTDGEDYFYVVEAVNPAGVGPASDEASGTPEAPIIPFGVNLLLNPDAEDAAGGGGLNDHWSSDWQKSDGVGLGVGGSDAFVPHSGSIDEIHQSVDLSAAATELDAGTVEFTFGGSYKSNASGNTCKLVIACQATPGTNFHTEDSGFLESVGAFADFEVTFTAPTTTRYLVAYLVKPASGSNFGQRFDNIYLICNHL